MKSRSKEFLDRATSAMVAAIEIYNKPDFRYRAEAFAILAINAWELLLKAKWLAIHENKLDCLYVREQRKNKDGAAGRSLTVKKTRSGNPFTHSLDFIAKKLTEQGLFDQNAWINLQLMCEMRDSAVHFYNYSGDFPIRLQEIGMGCLKNFVACLREWFGRDLSEINFYLMPLSFVSLPSRTEALVLNREEKNFLTYLESLEPESEEPSSPYSVTVNIDVRFTRSKAKDAIGLIITRNPDATAIRLTEEHIREQYPWDYKELTSNCRRRYSGFKTDQKYHSCRKALESDDKFAKIRYLDPANAKSLRKTFYNPSIIQELNKHYIEANV